MKEKLWLMSDFTTGGLAKSKPSIVGETVTDYVLPRVLVDRFMSIAKKAHRVEIQLPNMGPDKRTPGHLVSHRYFV